MTSQIQIDANRRNAILSTGPRTLEGKQRSRLNATRHNLTGQVTAMTPEDREAHDEFMKTFVRDLHPKTTLELQLATSIAKDTWRLNRIKAIEDNIFALGDSDYTCAVESGSPETDTALIQARVFEKEAHTLQLLSLYERRISSTMHKNLKTLREIQAERRRDHDQLLEEAVLVERHKERKGLPPETMTATADSVIANPANGSVFSGDRFTQAVARKRLVMSAGYEPLYKTNRTAA